MKLALGNLNPYSVRVIKRLDSYTTKIFNIEDVFVEDMERYPPPFTVLNDQEGQFMKNARAGRMKFPVRDLCRFIAPEILATGSKIRTPKRTFAGDIYSFGVLLFELAQNRKSYEDAKDSNQIRDDVKLGRRPYTKYPQEMDQIPSKFKAKDAAKKFRKLVKDCLQEDIFLRPTAASLKGKHSPLHQIA